MKKKQKIIITVAAVVLLTAGAWRWWNAHNFLYAGTVEATEIDLSSRLTSVIEQFNVKESDAVKAGQELVRLTCEEEKLGADIAGKDFRRAERLIKSGSINQENYDRVKYQYDDAVVKQGWCTITAPADGKVLGVYQEAGERVTPGTKLLTIADLSEVYVYFYVPQPMLAKIQLGLPIQGMIPEMRKQTFNGKVAHIRDEAEFTPKNVQTRDERTRLVYGVKVVFPNADGVLKPGMTIEAKLPQ